MPCKVVLASHIDYICLYTSREYRNAQFYISCEANKNSQAYLVSQLALELWEAYEDDIDAWYQRHDKIPPADDLIFLNEIIPQLFNGVWYIKNASINAVKDNTFSH